MSLVDGVRQLRMGGQRIQNIFPFTGAQAALGAPVVDRTGLMETFDIDLDYVPQSAFMTAGATLPSGPSLVTAVQDQLGLKFERREVDRVLNRSLTRKG